MIQATPQLALANKPDRSPLPRISVITPSLNQGLFIERTICSVLDQGYENLEFIVVDSGSRDETLSVLRIYEDELAWWISSPSNDGGAAAINKALRHASGDIVAILPADDIYLPGTLDLVATTMTQSGANWLVSHGLCIDEHDDHMETLRPEAPISLSAFLAHESGPLPLALSFFTRSLVDSCGLFDESMRQAYDYEYTCRLLSYGHEPTLLRRTLVAQRQLMESRSFEDVLCLGEETLAASRRYAGQLPLPQRYHLWRDCDRRQRAFALARAEGESDDARRLLWRQVLRRPWWLMDEGLRVKLLKRRAA